MTIQVNRPVTVQDRDGGNHELMPGKYNYGTEGQIDDIGMTLSPEALKEAEDNGSIKSGEDA